MTLTRMVGEMDDASGREKSWSWSDGISSVAKKTQPGPSDARSGSSKIRTGAQYVRACVRVCVVRRRERAQWDRISLQDRVAVTSKKP